MFGRIDTLRMEMTPMTETNAVRIQPIRDLLVSLANRVKRNETEILLLQRERRKRMSLA